MSMDLVVELSRFVQRIAATAKTGLAFKPNSYDAERYHELLSEVAQFSVKLSGVENATAADLTRRWLSEVGQGLDGYVTPTAGVGALVFNAANELLMIRRLTGGWHYPGGFCEVGLSPAENVVKEVAEETGLQVRAIRLAALVDTLKRGSPTAQMYISLFYCELLGGTLRANRSEVSEAGFFALDRLPHPLHARDPAWIELARQFHVERRLDSYFDPN